MLTNQSLEKRSGLSRLEEAATELYKALQAGKDSGMRFLYYMDVYLIL
jgi:hypothetical protein